VRRFVSTLKAVSVGLATFVVLLGIDMAAAYWSIATSDPQASMAGVHVPDPRLGWALQPGGRSLQVTPDFRAEYVTDADGYRAVPGPATPDHTIYFFGDSYTFGYGVDNDAAFPNLVAGHYLRPGVRVVNAGVSGYGLTQIYQRLLNARDKIASGDLVVFTPTTADVLRNLEHFRFLSDYVVFQEQVTRFPELTDSGALEYADLTAARVKLRSLFYRSLIGDRLAALLLDGPAQARSRRQAASIIAAARKLVANRGARFVLAFLPTPDECLRRRYHQPVDQFTDIDLMDEFPDTETGLKAIRFESDNHWNAAGHRIAARALVKMLVDRGFVAPTDLKENTEPRQDAESVVAGLAANL
jgi:lysophospholipase L1-like esterase